MYFIADGQLVSSEFKVYKENIIGVPFEFKWLNLVS